MSELDVEANVQTVGQEGTLGGLSNNVTTTKGSGFIKQIESMLLGPEARTPKSLKASVDFFITNETPLGSCFTA